jgi:AcrR family transcriptional regulator
MPIIVDKKRKKRDIALKAKKLLIKNNLNDLTIIQIANEVGIGKGTFYEYFKNKEELLFEVVNLMMEKYNRNLEKNLQNVNSTRQKIKLFCQFFYDEKYKELRELYKKFVAISMVDASDEIIKFQTDIFKFYFAWLENTINKGIKDNELTITAQNFVKPILLYTKGAFISSISTKGVINLQKDIEKFIDDIFNLIEVKK